MEASKQPKDVEMKDAKETSKQTKTEKKITEEKETPKEADLITLEDFKEHVKHIEKAVSSKEKNYMSRVVRALSSSRRKLNCNVLRKLIMGYYPTNSPEKEVLFPFLDEPMDTTKPDTINFRPRSAKAQQAPLLPELDVYFHLLVVIYLIDTKNYNDAVKCSDALVSKLDGINRRTMDQLSAKAYFYHSRSYELIGKLDQIRSFLHAKLRTSTLRHNVEAQATLLNLLLRNYLVYHLYDQADKLVTKSTFPEQASNHEWARFLYYLGRIKAIQLEYSEAEKNLTQALRKAPQSTAVGFKQTVHKLNIIVQLLLGEIPDRSLFRERIYKKALAPYYQLTQAVRTGNLGLFNQVLQTFDSKFQQDGTYTLIIRLHHNVIKTGVRMISLSYSKISLVDVAKKLQLDSPEDAEFIVAKAIRDGVIEATIDHEQGYIQSKETVDVYATREPMNAYHQRITFCLDIHNQAVKAMRFPPKSYSKDLESAEDRRERDKQDLELAKEMAEDDEEGF